MFPSLEEKMLNDVAMRARKLAMANDHNEARRFRRLNRIQMIKTDAQLERRIGNVFAIGAVLAIYFILWMVKMGWID